MIRYFPAIPPRAEFACILKLEVSVMAYKINPDVCVSCGVCKENCPVECIKETDGKMVINPDECVDCGTCAANCPVNAIDPA